MRLAAVDESGAGTKLPTWDVRPTIAIGGKADKMCETTRRRTMRQ